MAEFITETKNKIQEPGNDQGSRSIDVPPEENQEPASDVPTGNAQGQGPIVVIGPGDDAKGQGLVIIDESVGNLKEQEPEEEEEEEDSDYNPEERANFSRPPGKRSAPKPKTG
ncbi:uncharacterized protein LOC132060939 [Lycium ferocissimum]|uniref:uncharacterized protein LOC132060939 n=1 Tax=Lycium ferocissimum TaxID=112874 RepID=UPI0028165427|nr:uncharacterized protein LOC132060939 [Lycium ferocissimum]